MVAFYGVGSLFAETPSSVDRFQAVTATPTRPTQIPSVHSISSANSANAFSKVTHILYAYHTQVPFIFDVMAQ